MILRFIVIELRLPNRAMGTRIDEAWNRVMIVVPLIAIHLKVRAVCGFGYERMHPRIMLLGPLPDSCSGYPIQDEIAVRKIISFRHFPSVPSLRMVSHKGV